MHSVSFPGHRSVNVPSGARLIDALRLADLVLDAPCGGTGLCGKCKVRLTADSLEYVRSEESAFLSAGEQANNIVLSCRTKIFGDITVQIPTHEDFTVLRFKPSGIHNSTEINPNVSKQYMRKNDVTLVKAYASVNADAESILCEESGNTADLCYGLSLDVGTTTLSMRLIDLLSGHCLDSVSALNPQVSYGLDIITRVRFAEDTEGLETLRRVLLNEINQMILIITGKTGISGNHIYEAIFSGNPCMLHLVSGINPSGLVRYPFTPVIKGAAMFKAAEFGLDISGSGLVYFPAAVSAYIGADITSGILAYSLFNTSCLTLFIDIGTNGEIALASKGRITVASTAAGPAFEGATIKYGMRAEKGAIEMFRISSDGSISMRIIGREAEPHTADTPDSQIGGSDRCKPSTRLNRLFIGDEQGSPDYCDSDDQALARGVCGSGLIDIIAELLRHGVILENGRFESKTALPGFLGERIAMEDGVTVFRINGAVSLTQNDIRQVQLAKGAIRAGIELLLTSAGVSAPEVDKVLVAGAFGCHMKADNMIRIGLLPESFNGKVHNVGNSSLEGAELFLMDHRHRKEMEKKIKEIDVLQLANIADFEEKFIQSLNFESSYL